jgi:hypothetical protein
VHEGTSRALMDDPRPLEQHLGVPDRKRRTAAH